MGLSRTLTRSQLRVIWCGCPSHAPKGLGLLHPQKPPNAPKGSEALAGLAGRPISTVSAGTRPFVLFSNKDYACGPLEVVSPPARGVQTLAIDWPESKPRFLARRMSSQNLPGRTTSAAGRSAVPRAPPPLKLAAGVVLGPLTRRAASKKSAAPLASALALALSHTHQSPRETRRRPPPGPQTPPRPAVFAPGTSISPNGRGNALGLGRNALLLAERAGSPLGRPPLTDSNLAGGLPALQRPSLHPDLTARRTCHP